MHADQLQGDTITLEEGWPCIEQAVQKLIETLEVGLHNASEKTFANDEYVEVYTICYNMCTQRNNLSAKLYEKHGETIQHYLETKVLPALQKRNGDDLINEMVKRWKQHEIMDKWMTKFFMYLDRYYVKQHSIPTLQESSLNKFRSIVYDSVKDKYVAAVLDVVYREREGELIDSEMFHASIDVFVSLSGTKMQMSGSKGAPIGMKPKSSGYSVNNRDNMGVPSWRNRDQNIRKIYSEDFEKSFLKATEQYFEARGKKMISDTSLTCAEYLRKVEEIMNKERDRVQKYFEQASYAIWIQSNPGLNPSTDAVNKEIETLPKVVEVLNETLLTKYQSALINREGSDLQFMLMNDREDDLHLFFALFKDIKNGLDPIVKVFKEFVILKGREIKAAMPEITGTDENGKGKATPTASAKKGKPRSKADDILKLVSTYIDLHDKYEHLVKTVFNMDAQFARALKEAFETFLNEGSEENAMTETSTVTFAELLATFVDHNLKNAKMNETSREETLDKAVSLFEYLFEKDRFAEIYRNQLAKRLLNKSTRNENENLMISKFKSAVGAGYTSKMEGMVKDLYAGESTRKKFEEYCINKGICEKNYGATESGTAVINDIVFSTDLLTTGWWPSYTKLDLAYPKEMQDCLDTYEKFYKDDTEHKVIKWVHSLGTCDVKAKLKGITLELQLTTLQAAVLLLFNTDKDKLTFEEIADASKLDHSVLKKVLHSFIRINLLKKFGKSDSINKIEAEDEFSVNDELTAKKLKFKVPMPSLDESHNPKKVTEDRSYAIEASIVRIMKTRKMLEHNALVGEVMQQLHYFKPTGKQIKQRIEALIERDYLERDESNAQKYHYVS